MSWPLHSGAAQKDQPGIAQGFNGNPVAGAEDQQARGAEPVAGNLDFSRSDMDRPILLFGVQRGGMAGLKLHLGIKPI